MGLSLDHLCKNNHRSRKAVAMLNKNDRPLYDLNRVALSDLEKDPHANREARRAENP